jgi:hypothetical protein
MRAAVARSALVAWGLALPGVAAGQHATELVGVRALGMGGAFVGVADDASAVYWNPAGLPSGSPIGAVLSWNAFRTGDPDLPAMAGPRAESGRLQSLGGWPLAFSYARFQTSTLQSSAEGQLVGDTLATSQFGVTLVQTLVPGVVVGSTLKYVRGRFASAPSAGATAEEALDAASDIDSDSAGAFDLDLGFMVDMTRVRLGLLLKNLKPPTFTDVTGTEISLERRARFGVAILPTDGLTLAMDVDLDTVDLRDGLRRHLALGGESRLGSRFALRAGVRWSLEGARRLVGSGGASVALRQGFWVDAYYAHGADEAARGFGVALRAAY